MRELLALRSDNARLRDELAGRLGGLIGSTPAMIEAFRVVRRAAPSVATVLITGESGTGKELLARAVHAESRRKNGPFIAINCSALPGELIESELFGHVKGAFTGADRDRDGVFEAAHGGTLFLDEIGDMPLSSQTRLLRVLAEREVTPIGGLKPTAVDMRVVSATHCDLLELVRQGKFREDLFFRLNGATIALPALRERSDLAWMVNELLARRSKPDEPRRTISQSALDVLSAYSWPGNIRELVNVIEFACAMASDPEIRMDDLPDQVFEQKAAIAPETRLPGDIRDEAAILLDHLKRSGWNISAAARLLGIDRTTLHRRMRRFGVSLPPRAT
ncbi:MAG: sigma-54 interaction domain-containing protein [Longimicrobiales bacterium]